MSYLVSEETWILSHDSGIGGGIIGTGYKVFLEYFSLPFQHYSTTHLYSFTR